MKEYKLKINGNDYAVTINDVEDSTAQVEVNGMPFKVEFEKPVKSAPVAVAKKEAPKTAAPESKVYKNLPQHQQLADTQ
jgi:hypothetical protein